jgi:ribosomal protein L10
MSAPATNFVGVLAAVPRAFVLALAAIKDQKEAA